MKERFPEGFVWGTATSAYQVEGGAFEDGKGLNIWDVFTHEKGRIFENHNGDIACDHYHRYKEDVAIMKSIGVKAYRLSLNWARILPDGVGRVNEAGVQFYRDLLTELRNAGIEPHINLYCWDLPYELHKRGGWLNRDVVEWFGEYAAVVAERFSDLVTYFITMNEPQCFIGMGYHKKYLAPGVQLPVKDVFQMAHYAMMAHGQAVKMLRKHAKQPIKVGYSPTGTYTYPASESEEDIRAAREQMFALPDVNDWTWNISWFSDPVLLGHYPEEGLKKYAAYLPEIKPGDMELMAQPLDFLGQNMYNGWMVRCGANGKPEGVRRYEGFPRTSIDWAVTPECMRWGLRFLYERYGLPLYVTENGTACADVVSLDGCVHDPNRIDFLHRYLREIKRAIEDGVDVRGYFLWTLMDNFEWARGYSTRFGMVYVDYPTQKRIIKDSGYWYRSVIECNGENI